MKRTIASSGPRKKRWPANRSMTEYKNPDDHYPDKLQERRDIVTIGLAETSIEPRSNGMMP